MSHLKNIWPTSVSQNRREVSCSLRFLVFTWGESIFYYNSATVNISILIEQRNISFQNAWYFTKNHEIGGLVMRKVKKSWDSQQNRELKLVQLLLIFSSCLSPGRVKKLQKFINLCLKVGHSANLNYWNCTWRQSPCEFCEMYKISTSLYISFFLSHHVVYLFQKVFICLNQ